ncbi:hypothetical protein [Novosphingobium sp. JCM 18896]|uniref:hypothetical protein n=1 Tax=Novosphingobium sp. JCM 18896 TaxID=2989731 RepID=UPI00222233A2|nr:hypothetical protein [Novosphingobium sp. JCM 18896]MCW1427577.1 hypothetical protein [Novosphingobium sp. JCM 18896]
MSKEPIRVDSRAWTGDPTVVEGPAYVSRSSGPAWMTPHAALMMLVVLVVALGAMLLDIFIWSIAGEKPYFTPRADLRELFLGISAGALFWAILVFKGRRRLAPWVILVVILVSNAAGWVHFFQALGRPGQIQRMTFYVRKVELLDKGRHFTTRRFRAEAALTDSEGRWWKLNGRYAYILPLNNQDCVTLDVRISGLHAFPAGPLKLIETPYIDSIRGTRHPERCFSPAAPSR